MQWEDHVKRTCQDGHSTRLPVLVSSLYMEDVREMKTNFGVRQNVRRYVMPLLEKVFVINHMQWEDHVKRTCQDGHSTRLPVLVSSLYMEDVREMKTNFGVRQ